MIIRESIAFFFSNDYLYTKKTSSVNFFLNIIAISYFQKMYEGKSIVSELNTIKTRFLYPPSGFSEDEKELRKKVDSLITIIINQGISYKLIYNTFVYFIEDIPISNIDTDEILEDFTRYLAYKPEEIVAPIHLKKQTISVIKTLLQQGHKFSLKTIATELNIDQSNVSRQLLKIASRYNTVWRKELNWSKMGLHTYLVLIKLTKDSHEMFEQLEKKLLSIPYIFELYEGENNNFSFLYTVFHCPHTVADNLTFELDSYAKNKLISSFEIKPIINRVYNTTLTEDQLKISKNNYQQIISNKNSFENINLWNYKMQFTDKLLTFTIKEKNILHFLSILLSKFVTAKGLFGVWISEATKFITSYKIGQSNSQDIMLLFNKLEKICLDKNLLDYRLVITPSIVFSHDILVLRIKSEPDGVEIKDLLKKTLIFGSSITLHFYDEIFVLIAGLTHENDLAFSLIDIFKQSGFTIDYFKIRSKISRYVPYHTLYDYKTKKWVI